MKRALSLLSMLVSAPSWAASEVSLDIKDCESSALYAGHCPAEYSNCLWLADNEQKKKIYRIDDPNTASPAVTTFSVVDAGKNGSKIDDIEALAALADQRLFVVGSHSHKSDCSWPVERRRFAILDTKTNKSEQLDWPNGDWSCATALAGVTNMSATGFCDVVAQNAARARAIGESELSIDEKKQQCPQIETLNLEGAATDSDLHVWLGARAPLLPRNGADYAPRDAVLLRMQRSADASHELGFDQLRRLNLDGRGIRELSASTHWLWIIAGPPLDSTAPFALYQLAWAELQSGEELLHPRKVRELPTSAEGFALTGDTAWIAMDGDKDACTGHVHLRRVDWPQ